MTSPQTHAKGMPKLSFPSSKPTTLSNTSGGHKNFGRWAHKPANLTLAWLLISVPVVIWDLGYCLLRPWSMPGGSLHWPIWVPYEIYMETDLLYSWKAIEENNGFTSAQAVMNVVETFLYLYYLYIVFSQGTQSIPTGRGTIRGLVAHRNVPGKGGALALVVGFAAVVMTCSKTLLYGLNELFSGWSNVAHNPWFNLVVFYIIPNGAWLVFPAFIIVAFGREIVETLSLAAGESSSEAALLNKEE